MSYINPHQPDSTAELQSQLVPDKKKKRNKKEKRLMEINLVACH